MEKIYDLLILGGGPAGLTAAIYAGRYNLKTLVVAASFGGTANLAGEVENWPGFIGSGMNLMKNIKNQSEKFGAEFLEANFEKVEKVGDEFVLHYGENVVKGKSLVVALGTEHRQLNIPGEKKFLGKGVSYCATCDGNFFKNKNVIVIGGADSAAKAALYLADICNKVTIIYRGNEMRCKPISLTAIKNNKKITVIYNANPKEIIGEGIVKKIKIAEDDKEKELDVDGVFIEAGAVAATEILKSLNVKMDKGYIITGKNCKTNVDGVFAAGDVTTSEMRQMITAAGEGAIAAKNAYEFLTEKSSS